MGLELVWLVGHFSLKLLDRSAPVPSGEVSCPPSREVEGHLHVTVVAVHDCHCQVVVVCEVVGRACLCLPRVLHEKQRIHWL